MIINNLADRLFSYACSLQLLSEIYGLFSIKKSREAGSSSDQQSWTTNPVPLTYCISHVIEYFESLHVPAEVQICCAVSSASFIWLAASNVEDIVRQEPGTLFVCRHDGMINCVDILSKQETCWLQKYFGVSFASIKPTESFPKNKQKFRESSSYILASDLGKAWVLREESTSPVGLFSGSDYVYRKSDCVEIRSQNEWLAVGRGLRKGEVAKGYRARGNKTVGLYRFEQTQIHSSNRVYPHLVGVSRACDAADFIECTADQIICLKNGEYLWADAVVNGKSGICVYRGHAPQIRIRLKPHDSLTQISAEAKRKSSSLDFWSKLFRRVLIDRLVENHYILKK